jgi:alpha-L-rhamnosidase
MTTDAAVAVAVADDNTSASDVIEAYGLRCDHVIEPLGITAPPRFSWRFASVRRATRPVAVRVIVQPTNDAIHDAWDSGWRETELGGVDYEGDPLRSNTDYRWSVQVRDNAGRDGSASHSTFSTAIIDPALWRASWIGRARTHRRDAEPPTDDDRSLAVRYLESPLTLRRAFQVEAPVVRARVHVTAQGVYQLWLNGTRVGDEELSPGWTDYRDRILYQSFDITELARSGENVFSAIVAGGWWSGYVGFDRRRQAEHYGNEPAFWMQAHLEYADGTELVVATDDLWRETDGPLRYADLLMGEYHDARIDLGSWRTAAYDDSGWNAVRVFGRDSGLLESIASVPIRPTGIVPASSVERHDDSLIVDFGQNLVGKVRIDTSSLRRHERIAVRHGEMLADDGSLYVANLRTVEARDVFVSDGVEVEFEPMFTSHGFRYAEITGAIDGLDGSGIAAVVVRSDIPEVGEFHIDHPGLERLQSNIVWSQRSNFLSVPTDCPQRDERLGWLADAQVFVRTATYNADVAAFFRSWLRDVRYAQDDDGAFPDVAPRLRLPQPGAPGWGDGGVIVPWRLYEVYGDRRFLAEAWPSMVAWVDHVLRHNPSGIWREAVGQNYGDWLEVGVSTRRDVLATAFFAYSARIVAKAAKVLGLRDDADRYCRLASESAEAFANEFIADDGSVAGDTQTGYLLPLSFDLFTGERKASLGANLARVVERDGALTTGFIGVGLLLPVLEDIGRSDLAWRLALNDGYPSWLYSVQHGATTIWERWDGWTEHDGFQSAEMNSFNHYSLGSVGEWFYSHVCGIRQAVGSVGFERLEMRPSIDRRVERAEARFDSPRGLIESGWNVSGDQFEWRVTLPPGTSARIDIPRDPRWPVLESHQPLEHADGIRMLDESAGSVSAEIESGSYSFSSRLDRQGISNTRQ